jgi:hypothetical protein
MCQLRSYHRKCCLLCAKHQRCRSVPTALIVGVLPTLALTICLIFVPIVLKLVAEKVEGLPSRSAVDFDVGIKFFLFTFVIGAHIICLVYDAVLSCRSFRIKYFRFTFVIGALVAFVDSAQMAWRAVPPMLLYWRDGICGECQSLRCGRCFRC